MQTRPPPLQTVVNKAINRHAQQSAVRLT